MTEYQLSGIKLDDDIYCNGCPLLVKHMCVLFKHNNWQMQIVGDDVGEIKTFRPNNCPLKPKPRCNDCKYWAKHTCIYHVRCEDADWYCANWEKKE